MLSIAHLTCMTVDHMAVAAEGGNSQLIVSAEGGDSQMQPGGVAQEGEDVPEFDADWGLETLVHVGEHWIESLLQVSLATPSLFTPAYCLHAYPSILHYIPLPDRPLYSCILPPYIFLPPCTCIHCASGQVL